MSKRLLGLSLIIIIVLGLLPIATVFAQGDAPATVSASNHTMAIKNNSSLWAWGWGTSGQLGDGAEENRLTPIKIMDDVATVSTGRDYTLAIKNDGSLWSWGWNSSGQLGRETTRDSRIIPVKIMDDVTVVSAGNGYSAAIKTDSSLWVWGNNYYGQLGDGTIGYDEEKSTPVKIMDNVISVSAGHTHGMAIKTDGSLWTWGDNSKGQLGDGTTERRLTPVKIMDSVAMISTGGMENSGFNGFERSYAIKKDGSLWAWGDNSSGQLGDGTTERRLTPVKIMDNVSSVSAGHVHSLVIKNDGSLWAWGNNYDGVLGDGTATSYIRGTFRNTIIENNNKLTPVKIMEGVVSVSAGDSHNVAVKADGSLWTWGRNSDGQLGDGTYTTYDDDYGSVVNNNNDKYTPIKIMDDIMISGSTVSTRNYIYDVTDPGNDIILPADKLTTVTDQTTANAVVDETAKTLTTDQKNSATGVDKMTLFAEEAVANAATKTVSDSNIFINNDAIAGLGQQAVDTAKTLDNTLANNGIITQREINSTVTVKSAQSKVTIDKTAVSGVDTIKVETSFASVSIPASETVKVDVESQGNNKVAVTFDTNSSSTVKVSFPASGDTTYAAVVDENGNPVGGKYNPATNTIEAKISDSGVYSVSNNPKDFADIKDKAQEMQDAIKVLASKGVINGTSATEFSPDNPISRAEIAALIVRTLSKLDPNENGGFADVNQSNWYFGAAGSSKKHGIINGYEDNTFRGDVKIPKDQIIAVSARVLKTEMRYKVPGNPAAYLTYSDAGEIAGWASDDIALATMANLVVKRVDGKFESNEEMTRGDAAIILYRLFMKIW